MHIALLEDDHNPLAALPAFGEFVSAINERCASGPTPVNGTVVGAYGVADCPVLAAVAVLAGAGTAAASPRARSPGSKASAN